MAIALVYSSKTGNTEKVARYIKEKVDQISVIASIDDINFNVDEFDKFVLCYWNDKGTADQKSLDFYATLKGKELFAFGTLGAYPDSEHAKSMIDKVAALLEENGNKVVGSSCCQGKIDPKLTAAFKQFPEGHPHAMNEERRKRHEEAAKHPDEQDCINAVASVKKAFTSL